jgi:uncharacterized membrane protein YdjX (TVP38/TMEM64 family)
LSGSRTQAYRIAIGGCLAAALLAAAVTSRFLPGSTIAQAEAALRSVQNLGAGGLVVFVAIQLVIAVSGVLPASLIGLAAGAIYGVPLGFALAAAGTMAGAWLAFFLARSFFRPAITQLLKSRSRLQNFDAMLARDGWRFVFLLRLSPIMPFAATSYALGLSSIGFTAYWWGSLAALPALLGYVFIGSLTSASLSALSHGSTPLQWTLLGLGLVATVAITWRIGRLAMLAGLPSAAPLARHE